MALPSSGAITASMINVELGRAANAPFSLNDTQVRALADKPTGTIKFSDFWGKSNAASLLFTPTFYNHGGNASYGYIELSSDGVMHYGGNGLDFIGSWLTRSLVIGQPYTITIKNASSTPSVLYYTLENVGIPDRQGDLFRSQSVTVTITAAINTLIYLESTDVIDNNVSIEITLNGVTKTFDIISP